MYTLMHQDDILTLYDTYTTVANLCHVGMLFNAVLYYNNNHSTDEAQVYMLRENMVPLIVPRLSSEFLKLRLQALKILSIVSVRRMHTFYLFL